MKNKYYLYGLFAAALTLTGCDYNEDHFPGYDELAQPKDVWNDTITLADADYKTIAGIEANKELALSKDPEGETFKAALYPDGFPGRSPSARPETGSPPNPTPPRRYSGSFVSSGA